MKYISLLICFIAFSNVNIYDFNQWEDKVNIEILDRTKNGGTTEFIIKLKAQSTFSKSEKYQTKLEKGNLVYNKLKADAANSQVEVKNLLNQNHASFKSYFIVNVIYTNGDISLIEKVARLESVESITHNQRFEVERVASTNTPAFRNPQTVEWGLANIHADKVWELGIEGVNVIVAGQDTGVEWDHPAIKEKYRGFNGLADADHNYNWYDAIHEIDGGDTSQINPCGLDVNIPCDDHNHGTHTIGTMVGGVDDVGSNIGVAPKAKWIACRNMERGSGTPITYIECFEWFLAPTDSNNENPKVSMSPHVINNSWGCPESEGCDTTNYHVMEMVVNNVKAAGIVVVVSAGNSGSQGCSSVTAPASIFENSFTVGANADTDEIAGFSSKGPVTVDGSNRSKPDIAAPGVNVRSCIRDGGYANWQGTSMAGPHVAGVVALMISANPALAGQVDEIESIIETTARPQVTNLECGHDDLDAVPNNAFGHGIIDAFASVKKALEFTTAVDNSIKLASVSIFPNPVLNQATLKSEGVLGNVDLKMYSINGVIIKEAHFDIQQNNMQFPLEIENLSSGTYFYEVKSDLGIFNGKIIKQ